MDLSSARFTPTSISMHTRIQQTSQYTIVMCFFLSSFVCYKLLNSALGIFDSDRFQSTGIVWCCEYLVYLDSVYCFRVWRLLV